MYSVSKPELTYNGDVGVNVLSVELGTPIGNFTGAVFFTFPPYANQPADYDPAVLVHQQYNQAVTNAYELMEDALSYQARFISPDTHVSTINRPPNYDEAAMVNSGEWLPLIEVPLATSVPTKVAAKPNDKVGSTLFCRDCEQEITDYVSGTAVMPAAQVAQMTLGRWKRQLCAACSVAALKKR